MKNKLIDCYFVKIEHPSKKQCQKFYYEALIWLLIIYKLKHFLQSVSLLDLRGCIHQYTHINHEESVKYIRLYKKRVC